MKLKSLMILSTAALLAAAMVPAANAQDEGPGLDRPARAERAERAGRGADAGLRPGPRGPHRPGRPGGNPERLFDNLDTDGDGYVNVDEFVDARLVRVEEEFDHRDRDGDGLLGEVEARPRHRGHDEDPTVREQVIACVRETIADWEGPQGVEDRFDAVDLDGDGYIDLSELSAALEERAYALFDRIDSNNDGLISLEEVAAFQDKEINLRRVIRACIDEITDPFESSV